MLCVSFLLALLCSSTSHTRALLYPDKATSLGLVASVSVPITELLPDRRFIIDWCLQMAYDLPGNLNTFYNIPIWPLNKSKRDTALQQHNNNNTATHWSVHHKYRTACDSKRHPSDFTAGELYQSIEQHLESFGYHRTCLLRSVCELAQHPFADDQQNMLTDAFTFLLTPSLHQGFDNVTELDQKLSYEAAETRGFDGEDCAALYADCQHSLLSYLTNVLF